MTHSLELVTRFCDEALWLDAGVVRAQGDPRRIVDAYLMDVARAEDQAHARPGPPTAISTPDGQAAAGVQADGSATAATTSADTAAPADMSRAVEGRWGTREAEIVAVELTRQDGTPAHVFQSGEPMDIRMLSLIHI